MLTQGHLKKTEKSNVGCDNEDVKVRVYELRDINIKCICMKR